MKTKEEIESKIKQYEFLMNHSESNSLAKAIFHEKSEVLRWVLSRGKE